MELPVRILPPGASLPKRPVLFVDGSCASTAPGSVDGSPCLELSHWPGHNTPEALRHELSTGCALNFARLPQREREHLARGAVALVNNHYDTDGTCALFAARHPARALEREQGLLDAARSGDFFRAPNDSAFCVDRAILGTSDAERSPLNLRGADNSTRWQLATDHWMEHLDALVDGDLTAYRDLWERELEDLRADRADLAQAQRDTDAALDLALWNSSQASSRGGEHFDPGRHALFGASECDRVLSVGASPAGTTYRLIFSTLSWFDLPGHSRRSRGNLDAATERLNELEGTGAGDAVSWRCQPAATASPELWFGRADLEMFSEHSSALLPSRLDPESVLTVLRAHL